MADEIVTKENFQQFKVELLRELQKLIVQPQPLPRKWLKSHEVRQMLKISAGTLQTLRDPGKLPFSRIGGIIYYESTLIDKLIEGQLSKGRYFQK